MAVESFMVPVGTPAPPFALEDLTGTTVALADLTAPAVLIAFLCNHCPYVRHVEEQFGAVVREFAAGDLDVVAICSNDAEAYPDDAPEHLRDQAARAGWHFPYLVDGSQEVARAYGAACTPDFFLYDANRRLAYRGALDGSTPRNGVALTGDDLRTAIRHVLAGESVPEPHRPSLGCSIKWREDA